MAQSAAARQVLGDLPGTRRWNVTFKTRDFDLAEFRGAIQAAESAETVGVIVKDLEVRARRHQEPFRRTIEALGGKVVRQFWLINAATVDLKPEDVEGIRKMGNVLFVQADLEVEPLGVPGSPAGAPAAPFILTSTDAAHHNAIAEHAAGNRGTGLGIAIIDTGQDDDYQGNPNSPHRTYYRNGNRFDQSGGGIGGSRLLANIQIGQQPPNNPHPHGTGTASIVAGGNWGTAQAGHGHAYDAWLVGYSICDVSSSCNSSLSTEAAAWQRAAADRFTYNIVAANMAYSSSPDPLDVSQQAIDAAALNADILAVTAAGNGPGTSSSSSTANGLAVAACDHNRIIASFSSRGPIVTNPQRFFPDFTAAGVSIRMAQMDNESADYVGSGTSKSSAQVTGAAALVRRANPTLNARETKAVLLCAAEDISAQNPGWDRNAYGMGYLRDDLACSLARQSGNAFSATINSTQTPNTHPFSANVNQPVSVALVWHRQVMTSTNWSDLNLTVKFGAQVIAVSATPANLYEVVRFTAPVTGTYSIEVAANSLEVIPLPYSLCVLGGAAQGCVPTAPSQFGHSTNTTSSITWTWQDNSSDELGFHVLDAQGAVVGPVGPNTTAFMELLPSAVNMPFTRRVRAFNGCGLSTTSNAQTAYTSVPNLTASAIMLTANGCNQIQVAVALLPNPFAGLTGIDYAISQPGGGTPYTTVSTTPGRYAHTITGLVAGQLYNVRCTPKNGDGDLALGATRAITVPGVPTVPGSVTHSGNTPTSVTWTWTDTSANETGFKVYESGTGRLVGQVGANVTSFGETGLGENTQYVRYVRAFNACGESPNSAVARAFTSVHDPIAQDFAVSMRSSTQVEIRVVAPPGSTAGQTGVRITRQPLGGGTPIVLQDGAASYTYVDTVAQWSTRYHYFITFCNGDRDASAPGPLKEAIHLETQRLRDLYNLSPQSFFDAVFKDLVQRDVPKTWRDPEDPRLRQVPAVPQPPAGWSPSQSLWENLSAIYWGARPSPAGARDTGTAPADYRQTNFFAPYAMEFLGMWSGVSRPDALREVGLQAAQLARMGCTLVKLWYPFQAWKYRALSGAGSSLSLQEVVDVLGANGLDVIVTLGNNFGDGVLLTAAQQAQDPGRWAVLTASTPAMPLPSGKQMLLLDRKPERSFSGFYGVPGNDYLTALSVTEFDGFKAGDWTSYADAVLAVLNTSSHVVALQIWNEPDGTPHSVGPSGVALPLRVAQLIGQVRQRYSQAALSTPLMIGAGGIETMEVFAAAWLDGLSAGQSFLDTHIRWYGFHPAAVNMHTGGPYSEGSRLTPGWPPAVDAPRLALYDSGFPLMASVNERVGGFLGLRPGAVAILEELGIRGWSNQFLTDVDLAFRHQGAGADFARNTVGLGPWSAAAARHHAFATTLADGTPIHPGEVLAMQNRWRVGGAGHDETSFEGSGLGPANRKVHALASGALSRAVRPLILESPQRSDQGPESTLLVCADAFDDIPTHAHYRKYPESYRPTQRHRIWVRAIRRLGGVETETELLPLDAVVTSGQVLARLTEDPAFRDVDDNVARSGWPSAMLPMKTSELAPPGALTTFLLGFIVPGFPPEPWGAVPIDLTFGGLTSGPLAVPIPANPLGWPGFRVDIPAMERELMIRDQITGMLRMRYAGMSGRISGTWLGERVDASQRTVHRFALAFHRLVWKTSGSGISEHYGASEDAWNHQVPGRAWGNNYGDVLFNKKGADTSAAAQPPAKVEVVVVDVEVAHAGSGPVTLDGSAAVLPSFGDHNDPAGGITGRGAEALDPVVAAADDGTLVVAYRKAQDSFFEFPEPTDGTTDWLPATSAMPGGPELRGPVSYFPPGHDDVPPLLPVPYPTPRPKRKSWPSFQGSQDLRLWVFPHDLFLRVRSPYPALTWAAEVRLSEPVFPRAGLPREQDWTAWVNDLKNLEDRHGILRAARNTAAEAFFHQGWVYPVNGPRPINTVNPHTWHPALNPSLSVGTRTPGGELTVAAAWSQYPADCHTRYDAGQTAYEVRGLRLRFDQSNNLVAALPAAGYEKFTSDSKLRGSISAPPAPPSWIGNSVRGPVSVLLRPTGSGTNWTADAQMQVAFQMGASVHVMNEGSAVPVDQDLHGAGTPRIRSVKAATTPVVMDLPVGPSEMELVAWLKPEASAGSRQQRVYFRASLPRHLGGLSSTWVIAASVTEDPRAEIVAVIPRAAGSSATTRGRIVWKADGTIWWADLDWFVPRVTVSRVNSTLPGPFPAGETEVVASRSAVMWTHDGTVLTRRF